jgi:hypothetical protein
MNIAVVCLLLPWRHERVCDTFHGHGIGIGSIDVALLATIRE